ncbi:MAG TPA: apolipoprotein N-acyltransferase [Streptosporangiaceae bacterium]|jgi:apolipoprotein N-acyltransferase|nr:apolipoprotein N-acyltransferase [Streptosporangiaceae bacterium]
MAVWRAFAQPLRYAALGAGALPILAFPQLNLEFLGWCGLVPGLLIMRASPSAREAAVRGWWLGAGFILAAMYWLVPNIGPALLLVAVVFGVLWTGFGVAAWALLRAPLRPARALAALVVLPSYWVFTEWARSWQGFGGPWDVLGTSQWQHPAVLGLAAVGGVWLISFALVAANTGITILLLARGMAVRAAGAAGVAVALAAGPVAFALSAGVPPVRHVTLALVQPGITNGKNQRVDASLRLSARTRGVRPDLIVWGESSVGTDLDRQPVLFGQIRRLAAGTGAQVLVNQDASLPDGARSKVALLIGPHGIAGSYTKTRLVPFGEYIPLRSALGWIARISQAAASNMVPGDGAHLIQATDRLGRPLPLGVLICFESAFPDMSRVDADLGAQLIVYQTSDSTFQRSWAPAQHASLSAVRAAETGRPVVQAALTGDTVAFDARGRLLALMSAQQRGVTVVRLGLPPVTARTLYDRLGDYVPWTATAIVVLAVITGFLIVRPARGRQVPWDGNPRRASSVSTVGASPGKSREGQH